MSLCQKYTDTAQAFGVLINNSLFFGLLQILRAEYSQHLFSFGAATKENGRNALLLCTLLLPLLLGLIPAPENKLSDGPRDLRLGVPSAKVGDADDERRLRPCETLGAPVPARDDCL